MLAKVGGGRCDQSQQEEVVGRRQAHGVIQGSASGLSYKVSSSNLHQYPTVGNLAAVGNGTGILVGLCLQGTAALPFESILNKRASKTWRNRAASDTFNP